jgi:hypothetical protein
MGSLYLMAGAGVTVTTGGASGVMSVAAAFDVKLRKLQN